MILTVSAVSDNLVEETELFKVAVHSKYELLSFFTIFIIDNDCKFSCI